MVICFKKLDPAAIIPTFANDDSSNAGLDFYAPHPVSIQPHGYTIVDTLVAWDGGRIHYDGAPVRKVLIIKSRSGLAFNSGVEASNSGVVDSSFTRSIKIKLYNNSDNPVYCNTGSRIAQGIIYELPNVYVKEVSDIPESSRGSSGFGSSGK